MASSKEPQLVIVTWVDAHADDDFHSAEQIAERHVPRIAESVGWLVQEDAAGITIVGCRDDEGTYDRRIFIATGMVQSIQSLSASGRPRKQRRGSRRAVSADKK